MRKVHLFHADNWLRSPADRDIIARWSPLPVGEETLPLAQRHRIVMESLGISAKDTWEFLALGDTGDSDASGPLVSPQDAIARELTRDALPPVGKGRARLVLHTGDVIYMAGERRLYERNFRRPYAAFLTPESTVDNLVFRMPFLPVPGNHDYYDLGGWAAWLSRIPLINRGLRSIAHRFLGFRLPEGGSDSGRAFMEAFQDLSRPGSAGDLPYISGERTRIPHRYYQFTVGSVDFFALDSNTLDAPSPDVEPEAVRRAASQRRAFLQQELAVQEAELQREQKAEAQERENARQALAADKAALPSLAVLADRVTQPLEQLLATLTPSNAEKASGVATPNTAIKSVEVALIHWKSAQEQLKNTTDAAAVTAALQQADTAGDQICDALAALQPILSQLPSGSAERASLTALNDRIEQSQSQWSSLVSPHIARSRQRLHHLSEKILDIQRELALEQRRVHYVSEDFDSMQLSWLDAALTESQEQRPDNWRVIFLHHPLYTSIYNHCERPDVRGLRGNLLHLLQATGRVHLVLSGHSHAFEWFRSSALPQTGIFVTGGGGQIALRSSVFASRYRDRSAKQRVALAQAGVQECAVSGRGPAAFDGPNGILYHYLRIVVSPDALTVIPVGVRLLHGNDEDRRSFRREEPMPVYHIANVPQTPVQRIPRSVRLLQAIEIRRDHPPEAHWTTETQS